MLSHKVFCTTKEKPWVCFVHGAGGSSSIWFPQIKTFSKDFNVLLLDLRGHGRSRKITIKNAKKFNFDVIVDDILEVLDHQKVEKAHFIGISLGTIIIRCLAERVPERVQTMSLGGAVFKLTLKSKLLIRLGNLTKSVIPHILLYRIFANIIIPKNAYSNSRNLFIKEAKKVYQREFRKWFSLTAKLKPLLYFFREKELDVPTLYIMGEHDTMFLPGIKSLVSKHRRSKLIILENSGHVVNIDAPIAFNKSVVDFIKENSFPPPTPLISL